MPNELPILLLLLTNVLGCSVVLVIGKDRVFLHSFGSYSSSEGQFSAPRGIAISPSNELYVTDFNKRGADSLGCKFLKLYDFR